MGSNQSVLKDKGYTIVSEEENKTLVKNEIGDQFIIKKLNADKDDVSNFLEKLKHPHIVEHKEIIKDRHCLYLVMELSEGGDLTHRIKPEKEGTVAFSEAEILDWTVKICLALKHLHDQQILHENLQPKSVFFTACGTIRLGEFGKIHEWSNDAQTTKTEALSYVPPEILSNRPYDDKSEIWSLGCIIYEMCMQKCAFSGRNTVEIISKILSCSYKAMPHTFSKDLRQLVTDTLQIDPANRPSVSEILMRPFIIKHLYEKSTQTIKELNVRKNYEDSQETAKEAKVSLKVLEELADGLETVYYNTTVGSLTGGVVGLAGGITSIVGLILTPFTLGASLIVTGVGIGVAVAGGVTAGVSNVTKMVNQRSNRQKIKMIIAELQEKITSISCCIQIIQIAVEIEQMKLNNSRISLSNAQSDENVFANAGARLVRGLGGISELIRLAEVASIGKVAAQTARSVRVAGEVTGVLSGLFVAVDIFFIALDSKEIHKLRTDYASMATRQESTTRSAESESGHSDAQNQQTKLQSEILKFVIKIRDTVDELHEKMKELNEELERLRTELPNSYN
ncbi:serine/threonine-protein kinase Nek10-like [Carassius gibelio]|uniref:serine/threonine-protein kinase Nek10-like n=1 Tax=Carassius gibelio TaxID=101364 RepID=UPI0022788760|nr:serine/threonine-protein kinase Nek10-like [Carassius gibelio]